MTYRNETLAILTPRYGAISETFVRRHITEICPERTVVITRDLLDASWCPPVPLLHIRQYPNSPADYLARVLGQWRYDRRSMALRAFLIEHQVSAILGEWLNFSSLWFMNLRDMDIKFYAHTHGYDVTEKALQQASNRYLYRYLRDMDGIISVSEFTKQRLIKAFGINPEQIHVVPCGVSIPVHLPEHQKNELVQCLVVGRLVEKKGPLQTLRAFHLAFQRCPQLRLEFIGDGPLLAACERFVNEHQLNEVVTFLGSQEPDFVRHRLAQVDLFLLHSVKTPSGDEEGLPVAILEAMAFALPVISTRHAGIPEAVLEGATGCLVDEYDWKEMGKGIIHLTENPALRRQLGELGYQCAKTRFAAESEIRQLRHIIFDEPDGGDSDA